jgi:hypothetical protein
VIHISAFLVEERTISKILSQLDTYIRRAGNMGVEWVKKEMEPKVRVDCSDPDWKTKLGQKMWDLNQLSLKHRYGDRKRKLIYTFQPVLCTHIEAFKALQCWIYQCTEGDIPETSALYQFFDKVLIPEWAEFIVMRTPEYDGVGWG